VPKGITSGSSSLTAGQNAGEKAGA
jgi:hypothetical protein